ncbi:integrase [Acidithiobacillus thiooxidans]|uniref:Integrase n=2 Tax=Acidithiobacillus thiooxidans TaxID=930 RepID=A0A1C2ICR3_ACITH|nr:site-specific integrase [Acidithiobacillus thiooxidans]OCX73776.1 integrase [Acidithiobacillus thiooxidans]OCX77091.1 integrase [Acidithiobacillus thiooxidans]OCX85702.1 integrase [Acidithiobacillus thiooxidans]OCX88512.1 integrase [Acidithiobacillus thiooxidans]OFC44833.1 integrase [Acidithiobacillus thiooxidans]
MATIRSREDRDGITIGWQAQIKRKGFPLQVKTFRTKAEATQWATVTESEMIRGVFVSRSESERTTVNELMDRYAREVLPTQKGGHREVSRVKHLKEGLGKYSLAALTSSLIADYRDVRLQKVGPQSVKHELGLLQRALKKGTHEWGIALPNGIPTFLVKKPNLPKGRERRLVDDEETRLLSACQSVNPELAAITRFAIETAMRQGEIMGMTWDMVDQKRGVVHLSETKNGSSRDVPLSSSAGQILGALLHRSDGKVWNYTQDGMRASWRRALAQATISGLTFHDLRHEATSRLFEKGFNTVEVSAITGHKTLQMLKRYTHLKAEDLAKRMD